jgi:two-component system LytT family sensor kinase
MAPVHSSRRALRLGAGWAVGVLAFATQWFAYDATHGGADPFAYYCGWACYLWALAPCAFWLVRRFPIQAGTWRRAVPLHVAAGLGLTAAVIGVEASLGWLRHGHELGLGGALRHYASHHAQLGVLTYWLLVAAGHFYQRLVRSAQLEARLAQAQVDALRSQLQPHFLFNTLQAATTLIHEEPQAAEDILVRLAQMLRILLDERDLQETSLESELSFLRLYVGIQQCRFGDRLAFDLRVDDDVRAFAVPTLALQPLVENAIHHGIGKHRERDVVSVRAFQRHGRLVVEVRNRTGSLDDLPQRLHTRGMGLANTRARLEQMYGEAQSLSLDNLTPRGVCVTLTLPLHVPQPSP